MNSHSQPNIKEDRTQLSPRQNQRGVREVPKKIIKIAPQVTTSKDRLAEVQQRAKQNSMTTEPIVIESKTVDVLNSHTEEEMLAAHQYVAKATFKKQITRTTSGQTATTVPVENFYAT